MKALSLASYKRFPRFFPIFAVLFFVSCVVLVSRVFSDASIIVTAQVLWAGVTPTVSSVNPSGNPLLFVKNTIQTVAINVTDSDSTVVGYTITTGTSTGVIIPSTGVVNLDPTSKTAVIPFSYITPPNKAGLQKFNIYLRNDNDASKPAVLAKSINFYVY